MLFKHEKEYMDLSMELSDPLDWQAGTLKTLKYHLDTTVLAVEPISGLLATGNTKGEISLYGSPGVECKLVISDPPGTRINFLYFAVSVFKLLCVDEHNRLHIWDLTALGRPKLQKIVNFSHSINCLATSPSHTHALIALANGEIKLYDLMCLRISPYLVPNLWVLYEEKTLASGMPALPNPDSQVIVDLVIHPRDLNLLFIAYGGGVILSDLKQRNTVRAYELTLHPGAPGGGGYYSPDILLPRRPSVTALAIHPSGHLLAVGHADGSIAFWALEDEEHPLIVRLLDSADDEDVSVVEVTKLEAALVSGQPPQGRHPDAREPIFKLSWSGFPNSSDPRGGDTVLTVLGGLTSDSPTGVTTLLLPPLSPPAPPSPSASSSKTIVQPDLHPDVRAAMRVSLNPRDSRTYPTPGPAQDFYLLPRANPHFSGTWDAQAILLISDSGPSNVEQMRVVAGYEFPPPAFLASPALHSDGSPSSKPAPAGSSGKTDVEEDPTATLTEELASTLETMTLSAEPRSLLLPSPFWNVLGSTLVNVERDAYELLVRDKDEVNDILPIRGGMGWVDDTEGQMKLTKFQPRRILITHHSGCIVHFQDISSQLLVSSMDAPLHDSFPSPLPMLTLELEPVLLDPSLHSSPSYPSTHVSTGSILSDNGRDEDGDSENTQIASVYLASQSLECVTVLTNGTLLLYRLDMGDTDSSNFRKHLPDEELVSLEHIAVRSGLRYRPCLGVRTSKGRVSACALSDVGFLAVAFTSGALFILDLRGPRIMLRNTPSSNGDKPSFLYHSHEPDPIICLTWAVCPTASDPVLYIRLIAAAKSGSTLIYTLTRATDGIWTVADTSEAAEAPARPIPGGSFVLDAKSGMRCRVDRQGLATIIGNGGSDMDERGRVESPGKRKGCIWVCAGAKGVRCIADVTGERIAKADWGSKMGTVKHVEVIEKNGACALVVFTEHAEVHVYSLPFLEHMHALQLPHSLTSDSHLTTDTSGDFISHSFHPSGVAQFTHYSTVFAIRRTAPYASPLVDLTRGRGAVPPQPSLVSLAPQSVLGSWLGYLGRGTAGGAEIDALLAGPDRPAPPPATQARPAMNARGSGSKDALGGTGASSVQAASASVSSGVSDLYNRLGTALAERGQMLGDLEESFNSLEQGSKNMAAQAQKLAAQQTAKKWFQF
ncbi:hypothetical protein AcV5_005001 [Taiwanofungus camphoratus]|nr:hypothetical protein AcW2_000404 [Antrodia cinnamomea]KAI0936995.1 hypothetical protein AcV5_005001 [Antrodia cinnamomea]